MKRRAIVFEYWLSIYLLLSVSNLYAYGKNYSAGFIVPMQPGLQQNPQDVLILVNTLLSRDIDVVWLEDSFTQPWPEYTEFVPGDFFVSINPSSFDMGIPSQIFIPLYIKHLKEELNVSVYPVIIPTSVITEEIIQPKVGVFYGKYGAVYSLTQADTVRKLGFRMNIFQEGDIESGNNEDLPYNVLTAGHDFSWSLTTDGITNFKEAIAGGKGFVGICGGAGMLTTEYLGMVEATHLDLTALWVSKGAVKFQVEQPDTPPMYGYEGVHEMGYLGGPVFMNLGPDVNTLATFHAPPDEMFFPIPDIDEILSPAYDQAFAIETDYGEGTMTLFGGHPDGYIGYPAENTHRMFADSLFWSTTTLPADNALPPVDTYTIEPVMIQATLEQLKVINTESDNVMDELEEEVIAVTNPSTLTTVSDALDWVWSWWWVHDQHISGITDFNNEYIDTLISSVNLLDDKYITLENLESQVVQLPPHCYLREELLTMIQTAKAEIMSFYWFIDNLPSEPHSFPEIEEPTELGDLVPIFQDRRDEVSEFKSQVEEYLTSGTPPELSAWLIHEKFMFKTFYYLFKLQVAGDIALADSDFAIFVADLVLNPLGS